jgi:integrase
MIAAIYARKSTDDSDRDAEARSCVGGAQLETIQRHLGHQDLQTTMIYLHVPQQRQEDEIGKVFA